jgi:hypothetical protein
MKRFPYLALAALTALGLGLAGTGTKAANAAPSAKPTHVMADVTIQVVRHPHGLYDWTEVGTAHLVVDAWDNDPSGPAGSGPQPLDQGSISCESADPLACDVAQGPIAWVWMQANGDALISSGGSLVTLHDGGNPGFKTTGVLSGSGDAETNDWVTLGDWIGLATFDGWVTSGKVSIKN